MKFNGPICIKTLNRVAVVALFLAVSPLTHAQVYSQGVVGYVNYGFSPGANLFANPFQQGGNILSEIFTEPPPNGTTISLWNPSTSSFSAGSVFNDGSWSVDLTGQTHLNL